MRAKIYQSSYRDNLFYILDLDTQQYIHPNGKVYYVRAYYKSEEQAQEVIDSIRTYKPGDKIKNGKFSEEVWTIYQSGGMIGTVNSFFLVNENRKAGVDYGKQHKVRDIMAITQEEMENAIGTCVPFLEF